MSDTPTDQDARLRSEIDRVAADYDAYVAELTSDQGATTDDHIAAAAAALTDTDLPADRRTEVLRRSRPVLVSTGRGIECLLQVVGERANASSLRLDALAALRAAAFFVDTFEPYLTAYRDVLRDLLTDDDADLRRRAVSTLANEHDPVLQEMLADGLDGNGDLPVDRPTAIRALAEDDHLDNLPRLRELLASDSPDERQEAIRYLGSYPDARDEVEAALRNQDEYRAVRQQSAASLRALDPDRFQEVAKEIAVDSGDYDDVRTVSLSALQHLGDTEAVYQDGAFLDRVREIRDDASAPHAAAAAQEMLDRGPDR
ncbi:HEAT repeat domain-containing protein [Pseudonocardia endophytica]|uniref:HEAT repeat protein n=1 Tax=Pseudonocardia endophytica TaxID=401976 RepID=A0A4R1HKA8_PSEEN|nr:HEAT repeat domain-containing protein [Pseudonocardia endophytica]TCK22797.1 HEAT repeat protein [Pseudonocardia endophytica]